MRMKQIFKIDEDGYFQFGHDDIVEDLEEMPSDYIDVPLPQSVSFYRPKWTGVEWIEDMTQEEIDELKKQSEEPSLEDLQTEYNVDIDYRLSLIEMGLI